MKIDFKPQRLIRSMVVETKTPNGYRRILEVNRRQRKTIEMELTPKPNTYSKEYYVSSYNVYGKGTVLKSMNRNSDGNTLVTTRNYDGTYTTKSIK